MGLMLNGSRPVQGASTLELLLIDDDVELCDLMNEFLTGRNFRVEAVHDGRRGLARALGSTHDLILLDAMLPGLDGFEVLRQVRRRSLVPIIMLSARATKEDRIAGLEAGADDYLPKPFDPDELVARVRAVVRRAGRPAVDRSQIVDVNRVRLVPGTREVWADRNPLELTTIEFDILELLVRSAGRIVSRTELAATIHQRPASPLDRSLDVHVSRLRKKLGCQGELIRTIRGVGYLFRAEMAQAGEILHCHQDQSAL